LRNAADAQHDGAVEWAKVLSHESFGVLPKHHMHQRLIVWIILCNQSHEKIPHLVGFDLQVI